MPAQPLSVDAFSTKHLHADLKGRSVRGGFVTITAQGVQFFLQSISTVVLARLLTPSDFGLVAMVTAITGLASAFADLGLSEATIQQQEISQYQVSTLFWINVAIGLTLMLVTACLGPVMVWFYREPRVNGVALSLSLTFLIGGLRVQHDALLKRQMRFISLAIRDMVSSAFGVIVAIATARHGAGYWALVAFPLTMNLMQMTLSWVMVRWVPNLPRRDAQVGSMVVFGGNVAASYLLLNVLRSADTVLIGRYCGASLLGLYSRAYNLLMLPARQLHIPVGSVAVPAFSRLQNDPERFARYFLRTINLMSWINAPIFGFVFVAAEPVIVLVLGNQWREVVPVFRMLAISGLGHVVWGATIWLFISRGQSGRLLRLTLIIAPILIGSYLIGLPFGIKGVALSGSLVLVACVPFIAKVAFRGTELTLVRLWRAMQYPTSICLASVLVGELALRVVAPQRLVFQLLVAALCFGVLYALSALIPSVREETTSLRKLFGELRMSRQVAQIGS